MFTRHQFFDVLKIIGTMKPSSKESQSILFKEVIKFVHEKSLTDGELKLIETCLRNFGIVLYRKWKKSGFNLSKFLKSNPNLTITLFFLFTLQYYIYYFLVTELIFFLSKLNKKNGTPCVYYY